jgi:hypothetical protein
MRHHAWRAGSFKRLDRKSRNLWFRLVEPRLVALDRYVRLKRSLSASEFATFQLKTKEVSR